MRFPVRAALVALTVLLPTLALADPKDDARRRFQQGVALAQAGDLQGAIDRFLEADSLYRHPATTYNIAFAYQQLGQRIEALRWYEILQEQAPERAGEVQGIIDEIRAELEAERIAASAPRTVEGGEGAPALAPGEIDRLRAIAAELEALAAKVAERGPTEGTGDGEGTGPGDGAGEGTGPGESTGEGTGPTEGTEGSDGGFVSDAYERVVVTASRYGQEPLDSPSTVSIITADDIRMSGAQDVTDLLRRVAGVDVMSMSAGQPEISIRGFNRQLNNKVLVLIDGRSVYWDFIGTTQWMAFPIVLDEIERIEVIRGPGSAVYGANAVTGVVNIITRTPGEVAETRVRFSAGTPGIVDGTAYTSGRRGETSWRLSAGYQQHGRWSKAEDVAEDSALQPFTENQDLAAQHVRAHGRIDRTFGEDGFVSISGGYVDGSAEIYNIGVLGNYGRDTVNAYVRGDATVGPVHGRVFYNRVQGRTGPWAGLPAAVRNLVSEDFDASTFDAEVEAFAEAETGPVSHRVNGGVGYRRKAIEGFDYLEGDIVENHFNVFVNEEATIDPVKVVVSLRADRHPLIPLDKTVSPRAAAILRLGDRSVRVGAGTAFRVPTLVESYMDLAIPTDVDGVFVRDFGSRDLVPERVITVEAGFHDESTLYHQADVTVYYNRVSSLIGLADLEPAFAPYDPELGGFVAGNTGWVNQDDVYHGFGVELDGEAYPADGLDVFANLAVQRVFRDRPSEDPVPEKSSSLVKANAGVQYRLPVGLDLSATGHFVSAQTWSLRGFDDAGNIEETPADVPARFILSARAALRPFPDDDLELALSGWNLAAFAQDQRFREHPEGQLLAPRLVGSIGYAF